MDVVDANVLLYAVNEDAAHHEPAHRWLEAALDGATAVGFAWVATLAFVRIVTNPRILPSALDLDGALAQMQTWLDAPASVVVHPTARHLGVFSGLLRVANTGATPTSPRWPSSTTPRSCRSIATSAASRAFATAFPNEPSEG